MENEFCEIDFTTTTSWENFNARLEEIFYNWKLYHSPEEITVENGKCFSCEFGNWSISSEKLEFDGNFFFNLSYSHTPIIFKNFIICIKFLYKYFIYFKIFLNIFTLIVISRQRIRY